MKDIAIYGAGGFGKEVACLIRIINESKERPEWNLFGFFDDNPSLKGMDVSHFGKCLGGIYDLNKYNGELYLTIPIGNSKVIREIVGKITKEDLIFPNIIHPNAVVVDPESFVIGKGNIIQADCSFSCNVTLGDFNIMNGSVVFGHDDNVGSYNTFMPAVRVSGAVTIKDDNFFGVGSIILQTLKIGCNVKLGAGSVMMTKPKDGNLYIGNPAKKYEY